MSKIKSTFCRDLSSLTVLYWKSEEKWFSLLLLGVIIVLNLGQVYINVLINKWNNGFYNTLQALDKKAFIAAIIQFSYLAAIFIVIAVYSLYLNQMLLIRWRRWLTEHYLTRWLHNQNYYRMQLSGKTTDNPDQRISDDISQFVTLTLGLSLGLLSAVVTLFSFLAILWQLSGALIFQFGGHNINIPGYLVWLALGYSLLGTWFTTLLGKPLVHLNFDQQHYEADFRFSLVRLRENSESIAFHKSELHEKIGFMTRFKAVFGNYWQIMRRQKMLTWFTSGYNQVAMIFPVIVVAPRFFAGKIKLGGLLQTVLAFGQVQGALSYIISSFTDIATWKATTDRLITFTHSMQRVEQFSGFKHSYAKSQVIDAKALSITLPDGTPLLENIDLRIEPHESLLITGESGCGKTTLLRTLAGIWPFASGKLLLPENKSIFFLPQRPYLPLGNLKQALLYLQADDISEAKMTEVLELCQLGHLLHQLEQGDNWSRTLSLGEQQRIGFARAILFKPDFLFLDEATSAMDEPLECHLYQVLKETCNETCLISVGHRSTLKQWHAREWNCAHYNQQFKNKYRSVFC